MGSQVRSLVWRRVLRRIGVAAAVLAVSLPASVTTTQAITPFAGYSCSPNPQMETVSSSPASTANVSIPANTRLNVSVSNNADTGLLRRNDTMATLLNPAASVFSGSVDNNTGSPLNLVLEVTSAIFDTMPLSTVTFTFGCTTLSGSVPMPTGAQGTQQVVGAAQSDANRREPVRHHDVAGELLLALRTFGIHQMQRDETLLTVRSGVRLPDLGNYAPDLADANAAAGAIEELYAPDPAATPMFFFGEDYSKARIPLYSPDPENWLFTVLLDGAIMDGTYATLSRRTVIGTATFMAIHRFDDETLFSGGIKVGAAQTTISAPAATVNTAMFGLDFSMLRILAPDLFGTLYGGYEFNMHQSTIGAVNSSFPSHLFKLGATLEGAHEFGDFIVIPAIDALLQYRHTPAFTDGGGTPVGAVNTLDFDAIGGVTVERTFDLADKNVLMTPFAGLNLWVSHTMTDPAGAAVPYDPVRLQALAGVRFEWDGGLNAELRGDIARGAASTMFGITGTVSAPIH